MELGKKHVPHKGKRKVGIVIDCTSASLFMDPVFDPSDLIQRWVSLGGITWWRMKAHRGGGGVPGSLVDLWASLPEYVIVSVAFKGLGIDLVRPLPKLAGGLLYILVLVDYTTRYLKAVALCSAKAPTLVSWVGAHALTTSMYHSQMNGQWSVSRGC